jgi:AI-2 transport protein TqsA
MDDPLTPTPKSPVPATPFPPEEHGPGISPSDITRWGLNALGFLGAVVIFRLGESIFIPVVISILLAALLWPAVRWLNQKLRLPWSAACLLVVLGVVVLNLGITLGFALSMGRMLQSLPRPNDPKSTQEYYEKVRIQIQKISPVPLDPILLPPEAEKSRVFEYIQQSFERGTYVVEALLKMLLYFNLWLWQWILIMFVLLFLLLEGRMLTQRLVELLGPSKEAQALAVAALADMAHQVRAYLWSRTLVNILLGCVVGVFYYFIGLNQPVTWGLLTAILCYVPYIGPIIAGIFPLMDGFLTLDNPINTLWILVFYLAIVTLEGYVIVPVVMGRSMEMNATTVMLACLFWELVWGAPGLFLAMPVMAAIKAALYHMPGMRPWANLMSSTEPDPAEPGGPADPKHKPLNGDARPGVDGSSSVAEVSTVAQKK